MSWVCCKCLKITEEYPSNSYCQDCGNEDDFVEETEEKEE